MFGEFCNHNLCGARVKEARDDLGSLVRDVREPPGKSAAQGVVDAQLRHQRCTPKRPRLEQPGALPTPLLPTRLLPAPIERERRAET